VAIDEDVRARRDEVVLEQYRAAATLGQLGQIARRELAAELVATYEPAIQAIMMKRVAPICGRDAVEDWRQEAWRRLFTEIDSGKRLPQPFQKALLARAVLTAKDAVRACMKERKRRGGPLNPPAPGVDRLDDGTLWQEFYDGLSRRDAKILVMWLLGYASKEIAAELGTSAGAIDVRTHELRKKFRQMVTNA